MEHRRVFLTLLMVCLGFTLFAQTEGRVFVVEAFVCDSTGAAIRDVAVYDANNDLRSITDRDGIARIATRMGETLYLSHLSYKTKSGGGYRPVAGYDIWNARNVGWLKIR